MERSKQRRENLKLAGLCTECGAKKPEVGKIKCDGCLQKQRDKNKKYCQDKPDTMRRARLKWAKENPERVKEIAKNYNIRLRDKVIALHGGKCECCGVTQREWLHIDHKNKDGKTHRAELAKLGGCRSTSSSTVCRDLLKNPGKYEIRILCANCHNAITFYGTCPHNKVESNLFKQNGEQESIQE